MKLRPYQDEAADFIYERDRSMILAPVGAGKSAICLTAMQAMLDDGLVRRWLVVAPKRVCTDVWPVEAPKWAPRLTLAVAVGTALQRRGAFASRAKVVVTNYDALQTLPDLSSFDGVVFDELTRLKNPSGKRFKALLAQIDRFRVRVGLTGSFTSNGLEDVFGQCKVIDQTLLGRTKGVFMQTYFIPLNRQIGEWMPRKGALQMVMAKIKPATYVLEPGEYADTLPPLRTVELRCDMDLSAYNKMKRDYVAELSGTVVSAVNAAVVTGKLQQMASGFIYQTTVTPSATPGQMKATQTPVWFSTHRFDQLDDLLAENQHDNTLVVYNYREELAELKRRYPHAQTLDDPDAIARWNAGKIELLLVHPKSAGHGLNLQFGGNKIVFVSLPWSLELFEQTVGRLHRSGQTRPVWCYVLISNKTIDERIWSSLHDKRGLAELALDELKDVT